MFSKFAALLIITTATTAFASEDGITGESGQNGSDCNGCHHGGTSPTVVINGPASLAPGAIGAYTLVITGGAGAVGGLDVSVAGGGTLAATDSGTKLSGGEITHKQPKAFASGQVSWTFNVKAPSAGTITLYAAGNSCNNNGSDSGDAATTTTLAIDVQAGTTTVDMAGTTTTADMGSTSTNVDAGTNADAGKMPVHNESADAGGAPASAADMATIETVGQGNTAGITYGTGCSMGPIANSSEGGLVLLSLFGAAGLLLLRRRRQS